MTFEDYLNDKFMELHPMILDDDLPDAFNDWCPATEELIKYGQKYRNIEIEKLIEEIPEKVYNGTELENGAIISPIYLKQQLKAKWLGKETNE